LLLGIIIGIGIGIGIGIVEWSCLEFNLGTGGKGVPPIIPYDGWFIRPKVDFPFEPQSVVGVCVCGESGCAHSTSADDADGGATGDAAG